MSRQYPSSYTTRQIINYRSLRPVRAIDWIDLFDHQNLVFQKQVAELGNHIFDPAAETTSDTFTQTNGQASGARNASELNFGGTIDREIAGTDTGQDVRFQLQTFGQDIDVRATIENAESGTWSETITNSHGSSSAHLSGTADRDRDEVLDGSGNPEYIQITIEWLRGPSSGTGKLWQIRMGGSYQIPTDVLPIRDATP